MLRKILKIYTWALLAFIAVALGFAVYGWVQELALVVYTALFYALFFAFLLFVARWFIKRNLPKNKN